MTLKNIIDVMASGAWLRIATENGRGWIAHNRTIHLDTDLPAWLLEREVVSIYEVDSFKCGRSIDLEAGIAILVAGNENGTI